MATTPSSSHAVQQRDQFPATAGAPSPLHAARLAAARGTFRHSRLALPTTIYQLSTIKAERIPLPPCRAAHSTLNPQPSTLNSQHSTHNPQLSTRTIANHKSINRKFSQLSHSRERNLAAHDRNAPCLLQLGDSAVERRSIDTEVCDKFGNADWRPVALLDSTLKM